MKYMGWDRMYGGQFEAHGAGLPPQSVTEEFERSPLRATVSGKSLLDECIANACYETVKRHSKQVNERQTSSQDRRWFLNG